jgi:hypothetical protein
MEQDREAQVRQRAHAIWLEEGMPEGQSDQHWSRAEAEFGRDEASATVTPASAAGDSDTPAAPSVGDAPQFANPDPVPVPPDVEAIADPAVAHVAPPPAAAKKAPRRKTKPIAPIR